MRSALDRVEAGEPDPACLVCGGILKSATISFGQELDGGCIAAAADAAADCDVFLAVGTSLQVWPVAGLIEIAAGARRPGRRRQRRADAVRRPRRPRRPRADRHGAAPVARRSA